MLDLRRLRSAKERLRIDWHYPVYAPDLQESQPEDGRTSAGRASVALPRERAIYEIRADDRRPLLVVRECGHCQGTEDALLIRRLDNERTLVLSKWFRCIKLPDHVLQADHPFRNLFEGDKPPHLFLCRYDGTDVVAMDGQQKQGDLWAAMERLIGLEYEGDVGDAVRGYLRILNEYDTIDSLEDELRRQLEEELDDDGARSPKVRKLKHKLEQLGERRARAEAREAELLDLGLRPLPENAPEPVGARGG
ncbi:MAG: hypothetical protein IPM29_17665 [Planctomycetes bacterium]|nr:hypothetical protein [Planctomycetota bacterium]